MRSSKGTIASYRTGFLLAAGALAIGYVGATFFDALLSSNQWLTYGFVGMVSAIGLAGATVVGRTYWVRNNPFRRV